MIFRLFRFAAMGAVLMLSCARLEAGAIVTGNDASLPPLNAETARRLFIGRLSMINGVSITVVYQQVGPIRNDFETKVIGKTGAELNTYLARLIFTGEAKPPVEVLSSANVKARVNNTVGAIGYISDSEVDASVRLLYTY